MGLRVRLGVRESGPMTDAEFIERIDRHIEQGNRYLEQGNRYMEQGNRHMERGNRHMERGNQLMTEVSKEIRLAREQHNDLRRFIREINLRAERFTQAAIAELQKVSEGQRRLSESHEDSRAETRAQTQALLAVIDRLPPPSPA